MFPKTLHGFMVERPDAVRDDFGILRGSTDRARTDKTKFGEDTMRTQIAGALLAAGLGAGAWLPAAQAQQAYPNRPIKMILPFAAGGAGDTFARPLVQAMSQSLGQPIVIENIVGAAAIIGTQVAMRAPPTATRC